MITKITLNLAGRKVPFRYRSNFTMVEIKLEDGKWSPFVSIKLPCGVTLDTKAIIKIIEQKNSLN